jgi:23S rRNA A2030 N6-methylase RlmJ
VLVDPPFEVYHEFFNILTALKEGHKRVSTGTFLLWYPVKHRKGVAEFREELRALKIPRILDTTLEVRSSGADVRFDGSGMIVVNPPYTLESGTADHPALAFVGARIQTGIGRVRGQLARRRVNALSVCTVASSP